MQSYRRVFLSSIIFPLGATTFTEQQCCCLQLTALIIYHSQVGRNRHYPQAIIFGQNKLGRHGEEQLYTVQGYKKIQLLLGYVRNLYNTGKMISSEREYFQLTTGVKPPIMEYNMNPEFINWVENTWIISIKKMLSKMKQGVCIKTALCPHTQRESDHSIMDMLATQKLDS